MAGMGFTQHANDRRRQYFPGRRVGHRGGHLSWRNPRTTSNYKFLTARSTGVQHFHSTSQLMLGMLWG